MKKLLLLLSILTFTTSFSQDKSDEKKKLEFEENFFDAMSYRIKGDFEKSNELFQNCLNIQPKNDVVLFKIAQNYYDSKKYDEAETYINQAIKINDKNKWYKKYVIDIEIDKGTDAKEVRKLIADFSKVANNPYIISNLYRKLYRRDYKPKVTYNTKKTKNSSNSNKFEMLLNQHKYKELIKLTEKKLEDNPDDAKLYLWTATAYKNLKKWNKAIEYLDMGIDFAMDNKSLLKKYYQTYAEVYRLSGKTKKADKYLKKIK